MCEFLIYDKVHWIDQLSAQEYEAIKAREADWDLRAEARLRPGDIVEVRPDGFWTGEKARGFNQEAFRVVSVPGIPVAKALPYVGPKLSTDGATLYRKSRYAITKGADQKVSVFSNIKAVSIKENQ